MRKDYVYVDDATAICLKLTEAGSKIIEGKGEFDDYDELLLLVENEYICVEGDLNEWSSKINKQYRENYESQWECTVELLIRALRDGHIGVHKVVWDD
jgi:hypothetical protein